MNSTLRILIADDHPLLLEGTRLALCKITTRVTTASSPNEVRDHIASREFDLILLDLSFEKSEVTGFELLRDVNELSRNTPVLILSMHDERDLQEWSRQAGARGFVSKLAPLELLIEAVQTVLAGGTWFEIPELTGPPITARQLTIVKLLAGGLRRRKSPIYWESRSGPWNSTSPSQNATWRLGPRSN